MRSRTRRRRAVAAVVALAVVAAALVVGLSLSGRRTAPSAAGTAPASTADPPTGGAPPTTTPPTTADAAPAPADVAAARACQAFTVYLEDAERGVVPAAAGRSLIEDAATLLRGSQADQSAGRSLPRWAALGSDLLAAAEDVVEKKTSALRTDGAAAGAQCRTVPAAAATAGGFSRQG